MHFQQTNDPIDFLQSLFIWKTGVWQGLDKNASENIYSMPVYY